MHCLPRYLLAAAPLLQAHRDWSGDNLAERLAITSRTVRRDIDRPHELGRPVATVEGPADGYARLAHVWPLQPVLADVRLGRPRRRGRTYCGALRLDPGRRWSERSPRHSPRFGRRPRPAASPSDQARRCRTEMTKAPNHDRLGAFALVGADGFEPPTSAL
ncbi:helix-turn-helix domain-containing protein [Streptomyces atroolivaceus]|uniref:helix-turn-helix domain-containing protein n=1 Tax=Streptomyces atroolivaceus TaxID=66869 RepID=UPI00369A60B9